MAIEVAVEAEEVKIKEDLNVHSVNIVNMAMVIIVMSQMTMLSSTSSGVKRKFQAQDLEGQIIHDDGSSSHGRCNVEEFMQGSLKQYENVVIKGVTGSKTNPFLGVLRDGNETLKNVILLEHQNYGIDSPWQLIEIQGYKEDKTVDQYMKRYYKKVNGTVIEKLYFRKPHWTHFIRVNALSTIDKQINVTVQKMALIHENLGHPTAEVMIQMCDKYEPDILGFNKAEVKVWRIHGGCRACLEGKSTARSKDKIGKLVYAQYAQYGNMEGLHFDIFHINQEWAFLLVKSHKSKMSWVFHVSVNYTTEIVKEHIETVFGEYRYTGNDIGFLRSDDDPKFHALRAWAQRKGLRYYMGPKKIKTSRAERGIRSEKDMIRTILHNVKYTVPRHWIPYAVFEANHLLSVRYNKELGMSPREKFYGENYNYAKKCYFHFGQIISYPHVNTNSDVDTSRLNHGAIIGRDVTTGNLYVENFTTKVLDKVAIYIEIIEVDKNIQLYFRNYDKVSGFKYNKDHVFAIINNQMVQTNQTVAISIVNEQQKAEENPGFPTGPLHFKNGGKFEYQAGADNSVSIQSSYERFANLHDDEEELDVNTTLNGGNNMDSEKNKLRCFKVNDPGNHCHGKNHEMSTRVDIAFMIMNVMKTMNPNADEEDLITMSKEVVDEIDSTTEVTGLEELFIKSN